MLKTIFGSSIPSSSLIDFIGRLFWNCQSRERNQPREVRRSHRIKELYARSMQRFDKTRWTPSVNTKNPDWANRWLAAIERSSRILTDRDQREVYDEKYAEHNQKRKEMQQQRAGPERAQNRSRTSDGPAADAGRQADCCVIASVAIDKMGFKGRKRKHDYHLELANENDRKRRKRLGNKIRHNRRRLYSMKKVKE